MRISKKWLIAVLMPLLFCFSGVTLLAVPMKNWDSIRKRFAESQTDLGRKEIAKEIGLEYFNDKAGMVNLGGEFLAFIKSPVWIASTSVSVSPRRVGFGFSGCSASLRHRDRADNLLQVRNTGDRSGRCRKRYHPSHRSGRGCGSCHQTCTSARYRHAR